MTDDEATTIARLLGAKVWRGTAMSGGNWYVDRDDDDDSNSERLHPIEVARSITKGGASFSSLEELSQAWVAWYCNLEK